MPSIYRKTAKGLAEIETRANKLPPRLRSALIMVDGKRSDADLRPLLLQSPDETLASLLAQGFIEPVPGAPGTAAAAGPRPAPPAAPAAAAAPPAPAAPAPAIKPLPIPLPVRQRDAVRLLTDQVGPMAEAVAVRIEKARTEDELRSAVMLGAQVIANTRGRQAAERYLQNFADL